ncbi:MAG TPA: methyltransferase domain-containing protein [Thermodesulfobacteriota bacterium]|nr:methyltransferase domain-containing protein [Thermodesulfobacteriota bacterium]
MRLLNLGCGRRYHPDWVNVDFRSTGPGVLAIDLGGRLPFSDREFDAVYHSHLLEHLPKRKVPFFLRECFRVLKPGGILRVVVPDLEKISRLYLDYLERAISGDEEAQKRYEWILLEMFDQMVRNQPGGEMLNYWKQNPMPAESFVIERVGSEVLDLLPQLRQSSAQGPPFNAFPSPLRGEGQGGGESAGWDPATDPMKIGEFRLSGEVHQWMYDRYSLGRLLQAAGFQRGRVCRADESEVPNFKHYLLDIEANGAVRKPDSFFMEARKP